MHLTQFFTNIPVPKHVADPPALTLLLLSSSSSSSYSSSIGTTAHCGLWAVEKYPSTFSYLSPALSIFSLLALEDLFLLSLSILSLVFPFVASLPVFE
jgi:hypothetical protein